MNKLVFLSLISLLMVFLLGSSVSADYLISNSGDWRDVYSTVLYGKLLSYDTFFLVSQKHASIIIDTSNFDENSNILLLSSSVDPYAFGYGNTLELTGANVEEVDSIEINLELAKRAVENNITKYIVIDDSYGYNAISAGPYAAITRSFVVFADSDNIGDVVDVLSGVVDVEILIFGHVDREVRDELAILNPDILDEGDRFMNNVAISQKFLDVKSSRTNKSNAQIILSNGEFIEDSLFTGLYPILFLGRNNVPDVVFDFIRKNNIAVAILVGNQYVGSASSLRQQLGISVFVKFGRSARQATGPMAQVEGLDLFYMPVYDVELDITSIVYNEATNKLEVTFKNQKDLLAYFKGTYTITHGNNERLTVGDFEPVFIDANEIRTMVYDADLQGDNITVKAFVTYGESPYSLELTIDKYFQVEKVKIYDGSEIEITDLLYNLKKGDFIVEVHNIGDVDTFVDVDLVDIKIAGTKYTFSAEEVTKIKKGDTAKIKILSDPKLLKEDIEDNEKVKVVANHGERETNLVKKLTAEFELRIQTVDIVFWILVIVIIILFFLILLSRRKKKKNDEHNHHGH